MLAYSVRYIALLTISGKPALGNIEMRPGVPRRAKTARLVSVPGLAVATLTSFNDSIV